MLDSLHKFRSKESFSNLSALAHDSVPDGELGVILGGRQGNIVAVIPQGLHQVLVNNSPNETIEGRVRDLAGIGDELALLAVEGVDGGLDALNGGRHGVEEKAKNGLAVADQRVVALQQRQLDVDESRVLAASGVDRVLVGRDLLQQLVAVSKILSAELRETAGLDILDRRRLAAGVPDAGEFLAQNRRVRLDEGLRLAPVRFGAPYMQQHNDYDDGQDEGLLVEVGGGGALPDAVPLGVGTSDIGRKSVRGTLSRHADRRNGGRAGIRSAREVGEV